ncbi:MAG TPA: hypothetical protein VGL48_07750 [Acidimicrobiales bacterium]
MVRKAVPLSLPGGAEPRHGQMRAASATERFRALVVIRVVNEPWRKGGSGLVTTAAASRARPPGYHHHAGKAQA